MSTYILNESHNYVPTAHNNIQSTALVTAWFRSRDNAPASVEEVRAVIGHVSHPHGCMVRYLARQGRCVLLRVS